MRQALHRQVTIAWSDPCLAMQVSSSVRQVRAEEVRAGVVVEGRRAPPVVREALSCEEATAPASDSIYKVAPCTSWSDLRQTS